jgi:ribonuclease J
VTSLTFYGGVDEIGGNKVLVEDQNTRLFLDFGMSFGLASSILMSSSNPANAAANSHF